MTKFDELKEHGAQYMATELCVYISDHIEDCDHCPLHGSVWKRSQWRPGLLDGGGAGTGWNLKLQ